MDKWFEQPFHQRARAGGETRFGHEYRGGQFLPFYVPRPVMPQIDEADFMDFIEFANERGITVAVNYLTPEHLHPHQRIDRIHAERMPPEVRAKTIFVSRDWYILDGNHRWALHLAEHSKIAIFQVDLPFEEAVSLMFEFPKTYALEYAEESN